MLYPTLEKGRVWGRNSWASHSESWLGIFSILDLRKVPQERGFTIQVSFHPLSKYCRANKFQRREYFTWVVLEALKCRKTHSFNSWLCHTPPYVNIQEFLFNIIFYYDDYLYLLCWVFVAACNILTSWPGIEPKSLALGAGSLIHWTIREAPKSRNFWTSLCILLFSHLKNWDNNKNRVASISQDCCDNEMR